MCQCECVNVYVYVYTCVSVWGVFMCVFIPIAYVFTHIFLDGYCSTVQGLLDWFEVDVGVTKLLLIQTDLCVVCVGYGCVCHDLR